jgi:hypothetical protein
VAAVAVWTVALVLFALLVAGALREHRHGYPWYRNEFWWVAVAAGAGCVLYTTSVLRTLHAAPSDR